MALWTAQISSKIPKNSTVFTIVRHPKNSKMINLPELAPSSKLLKSFKSEQLDGFKDFEYLFIDELNERIKDNHGNSPLKSKITGLQNLAKTTDVFLLCYCSDYDWCHRKIVGKILGAKEWNNEV